MTEARSAEILRTGGCQCGAVRYQLSGQPSKVVICHCGECRKQSAAAFGISLFVERGALRVTQGAPKLWSRPTNSGRVLECAFCPGCGSRLWHQPAGGAGQITVKAGSLDEPIDVSGAVHIWTARRTPGIVIPEHAVSYPYAPS